MSTGSVGVETEVTLRYRCAVCADFDLCATCYKKPTNKQHRTDHCFTLIAKPVTLWSVKTREPRGVPLGDLPCEMCHNRGQGGARYGCGESSPSR